MIICPKCGWENQDEFNFCLGCGHQLTAPEPEIVPEPPPAETSVDTPAQGDVAMSGSASDTTAAAESVGPNPNGMDCPSCGADMPPGHIFCGRCGFRVPEQPEPRPTVGPPTPEPMAPPAPEPVAEPEPVPAPTPAPAPEPPARLVLLLPNGEEGGSYPLKGEHTQIGRSKGNILFLDDPYVSPLHATFHHENGRLNVKNEDSLNGLFIRLRERVELNHGDILLLGKQLLRFEQIERQPEVDSEMNIHEPPATPIWGSPYGSYWGRLIQLISGGSEGNAILLGGEQVELGRERGQITFPGDRFISSLHARVLTENNRFYVEDVGSRNGTFIQIRGEHSLTHKDILIIGEQLLRVELQA